MSEENAELLRRAVDAYNRRDVDALLRELDPQVQWLPALPGLLAERPASAVLRPFSSRNTLRATLPSRFASLSQLCGFLRTLRDTGEVASSRTREGGSVISAPID